MWYSVCDHSYDMIRTYTIFQNLYVTGIDILLVILLYDYLICLDCSKYIKIPHLYMFSLLMWYSLLFVDDKGGEKGISIKHHINRGDIYSGGEYIILNFYT